MKTSEDLETTPPGRTAGDYVYTGVKAIVSAMPYVGGPIAELLTLVIAPPLEKRRDEWLKDLAEVVKTIAARKGISPEELSKSDSFISASLQASQVAIRTHQA